MWWSHGDHYALGISMCIVPHAFAYKTVLANIETTVTHGGASACETGFHSEASLTLHTSPLDCIIVKAS